MNTVCLWTDVCNVRFVSVCTVACYGCVWYDCARGFNWYCLDDWLWVMLMRTLVGDDWLNLLFSGDHVLRIGCLEGSSGVEIHSCVGEHDSVLVVHSGPTGVLNALASAIGSLYMVGGLPDGLTDDAGDDWSVFNRIGRWMVDNVCTPVFYELYGCGCWLMDTRDSSIPLHGYHVVMNEDSGNVEKSGSRRGNVVFSVLMDDDGSRFMLMVEGNYHCRGNPKIRVFLGPFSAGEIVRMLMRDAAWADKHHRKASSTHNLLNDYFGIRPFISMIMRVLMFSESLHPSSMPWNVVVENACMAYDFISGTTGMFHRLFFDNWYEYRDNPKPSDMYMRPLRPVLLKTGKQRKPKSKGTANRIPRKVHRPYLALIDPHHDYSMVWAPMMDA